jgi:hypothetical protein
MSDAASLRRGAAGDVIEHEHLKDRPRDLEGHRAHSARLRAHLDRLHAYVATRDGRAGST